MRTDDGGTAAKDVVSAVEKLEPKLWQVNILGAVLIDGALHSGKLQDDIDRMFRVSYDGLGGHHHFYDGPSAD